MSSIVTGNSVVDFGHLVIYRCLVAVGGAFLDDSRMRGAHRSGKRRLAAHSTIRQIRGMFFGQIGGALWKLPTNRMRFFVAVAPSVDIVCLC